MTERERLIDRLVNLDPHALENHQHTNAGTVARLAARLIRDARLLTQEHPASEEEYTYSPTLEHAILQIQAREPSTTDAPTEED